jgi:hypothetical protein
MREFVNSEAAEFTAFVAVCLAGLLIVGLMIDWFRRQVIKTHRPKLWALDPDRAAMSIAESRRWERRLALLHEIDPPEEGQDRGVPYYGPVKVVKR